MAEENAEKVKLTRGIAATLPPHAQEEMREANRELGMALEVVRGIVDAHVAGSLPPGKVTESVVKRRREDDEAALAKRRLKAQESQAGAHGEGLSAEPPSAQVVDLVGALKAGLAAGKGGAS